METVKRPSHEETGDDLLREQELFLKAKVKSSVNIKRIPPLVDECLQECPDKEVIINPEEDLVVHHNEVILEVQERITSDKPFVFQLQSPSSDELFNLVEKQNLSKFASNKIKEKLKEKSSKSTENKETMGTINSHDSNSSSVLVDGSGLENRFEEVRTIHNENKAKISAMSAEEIVKYQAQLKNCLDPTVIKFIQNKRKLKSHPDDKENLTTIQAVTEPNKILQNVNQDFVDGEILRKEGNDDCDAVILQKSFSQIEPAAENFNLPKTSLNKNIEIPEETKKLLEESNKGKWKNMNKIEKEKLEWLSELPKPNPIDLKTGYSARFDFEGKLLPYGLDIPVYKGLHHHGKEPEIAGYSLEELFLLTRSTIQSQRITALHTLAHILDNYWYGMMDSCFDSSLLQTLLDAGLVPFLRWALDDTSVTSVAATVTAIHSLLISKLDEACLMKTFCWLNGHLMPFIEPSGLEESNIVIEEMTDADLIKLDVIKGFLRMDILPRFHYILQIMQPPPLVCKLIIEICCHLAQHSKESAFQVGSYPGLMKLLFNKFLPTEWQFIDGSKLNDTVDYSCPMPSALKLVRILCSASKELASVLMQNYELQKVLTMYLSLRPVDEKLSIPEVQSIMIESLKSLHILLSYGFGFQVFLDLFPIFLRQMEFCLSLNMNAQESKHCQDFEYTSHFFKMLEAVVVVSAEETNCLVTLVDTFFKQSIVCLKKWFHQLKQEKPCDAALSLISSTLNFVTACFNKLHKGIIGDDRKYCSLVKDFYNNFFAPCLTSDVFKSLIDQLCSHSLLLCSEQSGNKRDSRTIVSLGSVMWEGDVVPLLMKSSPIPLFLASFNFVSVFKILFDDGNNQLIKEIFNTSILKYLKRVSSQKLNACSWFARYETNLIALLLKLSCFMEKSNRLECHKVATSLLSTFKMPDECVVEDILENVIFNKEFLPSLCFQAIQDIISMLPVIAKCYISYFFQQPSLKHSRNFYFGSIKIQSLASSSNAKSLLPEDWFYAPIFKLYHTSTRKKLDEPLRPEDLLLVTSNLQWIFLCHEFSLPLLKCISASVEFCYLSMVFLLDEDCFHCPKIKFILEENLKMLVQENSWDFSNIKSDNIVSFDDLYLELLNQFEAVSYGDQLFGNFILLPLQQCHHKRWKKVLLTDHSHAISFLRVPLSKLIVPVKQYLEPFEKDFEILKEYLKLLLNGYLTPQRCPVIYLMAVYHLHHFIFLKSVNHLNSQKYLLKNIIVSKNEVVRHHILLYENLDFDSECGFSLGKKLTLENQQHINRLVELPFNL